MIPKSVLMVVAKYPATHGHTTVINNLCIGLNRMGIETSIGAFSFENDPPNNIKKVILNKRKLLSEGIRSLDYDIIHVHQPRVNYYLLFIKPDKPVVLHIHGASTRIQEINFKFSMWLHKKRISKIIAVSNAAVSQIRRIVGDISTEIVYNGVDTNFYKPDLVRPYKKGDPQLLFVSALRRYKNTEAIIKTMPILLKKYPNAHLQIVGDGEDYGRLKKIVENEQLQEKIELTGKITDQEELRLRYTSCDLYVSASKIEACPVPPFEAMASGKPIVLYDIDAHREIVNLSKAGVVFSSQNEEEICDKIVYAYQNKDHLSNMARKFAEDHDWATTCKQIVSIYEKILR
ncbi:MAG TPA: glycosyltransferase family 4 protein [Nitrosopumilaceae archaeon]|nr:glycosyltransferase family 4 protein [Nitrosopumilaceae archaeon]